MSGPTAAALVLADGSTFEGEWLGAAQHLCAGEVVFNTAMAGYQEVLTDPSYAGQIITFTYPHIGNYGVTELDAESRSVFARGVIIRDIARRASNHRAQGGLDSFLADRGVGGIGGIDTRRLTRLLRDQGSMNGAFGPTEGPLAATIDELSAAAETETGTAEVDLVAQVSTESPYEVGQGPRRIVAYDFGIKTTMVAMLGELGTVEVVPAGTSAADVMARQPDGVFLSNGPGDPAQVPYAAAAVAELLGNVPIFGICLGHQILSRAIGGETLKLPFGHHGANHPVQDKQTGVVEITSQNHNFAVAADSISGVADITHVNLNDGVCEGMSVRNERAFSVQYHPEAAPGPHDSQYLFDRFVSLMDGNVDNDKDR